MSHPPLDVETRLRMLAEQSHEHAFVLLDADGIITWWSAGAERIFGIPRDVAVGRHCELLFPRGANARALAEQEIAVARSGARAEDDRWLARGDGSSFWATGAMLALKDASGRVIGFGKILRDRTDLIEQLEALRNRIAALQAHDRRKDVFLSTVAHELRNPLGPIANAVQLIRVADARRAETGDALKIIDRQLEALRRLVDDLLDLSRGGAGKIELEKQPLSLQEVLTQAVGDLRSLPKARRLKLETLWPPTPIVVNADRDRLRQVFVNLIENALKYTPEGGHIWVKATTEGKEGVVHIEDTGVGIPTDMLPHIFELFTQVESTRPQSKGGLGIGLSVVKDLVALHGGSVQVKSDGEGKGSTFTVRLPLALTD